MELMRFEFKPSVLDLHCCVTNYYQLCCLKRDQFDKLSSVAQQSGRLSWDSQSQNHGVRPGGFDLKAPESSAGSTQFTRVVVLRPHVLAGCQLWGVFGFQRSPVFSLTYSPSSADQYRHYCFHTLSLLASSSTTIRKKISFFLKGWRDWIGSIRIISVLRSMVL